MNVTGTLSDVVVGSLFIFVLQSVEATASPIVNEECCIPNCNSVSRVDDNFDFSYFYVVLFVRWDKIMIV
jgi:hypothetical protein